MPYDKVRPESLKSMVRRLQESIYVPLSDLKVTVWVTPEPTPFSERYSGRRAELQAGDRWGELWDCGWFHFTGSVPKEAVGAKVVLLIDVNGELCLVDHDGTPRQGLTNINSEFDYSLGLPGKRVVHVCESSTGEETIDLWGDAGCNDLFGRFRSGTLKEAVIAICREQVRQLYYDAEVLLETAEQLPSGSARKERIFCALSDASLLLTELTDQRIAEARRILGKQLAMRGGDPVLTISAIGHAHIDLAWLWPIRETIRKGARTFSTALRMMERYPDYVFGASQPQLYDWIKKYYPKLYAEVKQKIKEGRWEPQGAMWVESDTNVPGGESLVRQILYGKRYFLQEFGRDMKTLWMPDVFGYSASLPQILKKSGVDYMMTQKLSWNMYNRHPHHTFFWEGIDGSKVLTHMPPEDTYNSPAAPRSIIKAETEYLDKSVSDRCLMLFGIGDGGGGPGEEHLERLSREKNLLGLCPVVQEPSDRFFERLAENADRYQAWRGELYLEKHQGTLTSQARNKRFNRKLEKALRELEFASVLAWLADEKPYPSEELEVIWKEVLLYQFHDILPGSSIKRVYDESLDRYAALLEQVERMIETSYRSAAGAAGAGDRKEPGVAVFNSLPWEREQWLKLDVEWLLLRVPPMGFVTLEPQTLSTVRKDTPFHELNVSITERIAENELLKVTFSPDGGITSIWDKEQEREVILPGQIGNDLRVYHDEGDAWDFEPAYRLSGGTPLLVEEMQSFAEGPTTGLLIRYKYGLSSLTQKVVLTAGSRTIDFVTEADWKEAGTMLRTSFPVNVRSDTVNCEIQFGHIKRPTHRNTMWDFAKDEICAHHWIDISEPDYGVALLNDCKYGHRAEQNVLDINLLRSPSYPDPEADRAKHTFTYSIYPHSGDHVQAEVYKRGYELNVPLRTIEYSNTIGSASKPASFLKLDHPNVMIETVKRAEDGNDVIVRLYETAGTRVRTDLHTGFRMSEAWLADLMEERVQQLHSNEHTLNLSFTPFEIKTLRLTALFN
ncbi:alpha-mannosidase [Paenibacillus thermotolerans]|uniref:alpha-mannosidase n=1 Tax=Paenibacillus thermotolerans TaxID=3027807 RepID=UPI0023679CBF|nr:MULTISPECIES: glycoside hydrolase family 38 C-terminal domain-containing protein [unclassified Paenibacillus]